MSQKVRVRFAPSPTGPLHIGGVRTALYNYLFAKRNNGDFILRIEDTDSQRFVEGAEDYIIEALTWLGLDFDEGTHVGGKYGPYRQSDRKTIYRQYVDQLLDKGAAYIAFDTPAELEAKRETVQNFQYDASTRGQMRNSLTLSAEETAALIDKGENYVVRFKIEPQQSIIVNDLIRGEVSFNSSILDDKVLFKSADNLPTYHLANIVDDHLMEISHVIRGEEWLPSAPLHILLYRAFEWEASMPLFAHLPLLLKPDGKGKLSKRDGDRLGFPVFPLEWKDPKTGEISAGYRESGYYPDAVINFLALLGWNPGKARPAGEIVDPDIEQELFSLNELISLFSTERCSKGGAKFDYEKAKWFNHQYLQMQSNEALAEQFAPILKEKKIDSTIAYITKVVGLVKERVSFVNELWEQTSFFFLAPISYDEKTVKKRWKEETPEQLKELIVVLQELDRFDAHYQEEMVKSWIESKAYHLGNIMNAFRLAVVGESKGPHMFDITETLGKTETIVRIENALLNISK